MLRAAALALALALLTSPASALEPVASLADGRAGAISFRSQTPTGPSELLTRTAAPAVISGELRLPEQARGPSVWTHLASPASSSIRSGRAACA